MLDHATCIKWKFFKLSYNLYAGQKFENKKFDNGFERTDHQHPHCNNYGILSLTLILGCELKFLTVVNVVVADDIFKATLSVYMDNTRSPLPTLEEVLVCNPSTTAEEV